jgi:tRNA nucleotidyltransferase (CCA-adding enzyme)
MKRFHNPDFDREYDEVVSKVREMVVPDENERNRGLKAKEILESRMKRVLENFPDLEFRFLGSFPRNTWLKGNLEIDLFILFPESYSEEELEKIGLEIGRKVVDRWEERFASHPYVHGWVGDVEVDVVPCYRIKGNKIISAVDRTPLHHEWVKDRIKGKEDDVRLLKSFLKAGGIYGAEYAVRGFSGYLCELLILHYGSFKELVKAACGWRRGLVIDILAGKESEGKAPLFVVDPVDAKRNVAANLSLDNMAKFVERCRDFYLKPSVEFFVFGDQKYVEKSLLAKEIKSRGTELIAVEFSKPAIVEDNLYTQLERARKKITKFLQENDFMPINSDYLAHKTCILVFETQVKELSRIKKVMGPPFEEWTHTTKFREKKREYLPFIEGGRYYVYERRKITKPSEAVKFFIENNPKTLGKNISEEISKGFRIFTGNDVLKLEGIEHFLVKFLKMKV